MVQIYIKDLFLLPSPAFSVVNIMTLKSVTKIGINGVIETHLIAGVPCFLKEILCSCKPMQYGFELKVITCNHFFVERSVTMIVEFF